MLKDAFCVGASVTSHNALFGNGLLAPVWRIGVTMYKNPIIHATE